VKIEPERYLFSKIEYRDYDVLLPFSCRKTGSCCSVYVPRIPYEHLEVLAQYLGLPADEVIADYRFYYGKKLKGQSVRCPFLDNHNLCQIYHHFLRPWVCYLFPFSYGGEVIRPARPMWSIAIYLIVSWPGKKNTTYMIQVFAPILIFDPSRRKDG